MRLILANRGITRFSSALPSTRVPLRDRRHQTDDNQRPIPVYTGDGPHTFYYACAYTYWAVPAGAAEPSGAAVPSGERYPLRSRGLGAGAVASGAGRPLRSRPVLGGLFPSSGTRRLHHKPKHQQPQTKPTTYPLHSLSPILFFLPMEFSSGISISPPYAFTLLIAQKTSGGLDHPSGTPLGTHGMALPDRRMPPRVIYHNHLVNETGQKQTQAPNRVTSIKPLDRLVNTFVPTCERTGPCGYGPCLHVVTLIDRLFLAEAYVSSLDSSTPWETI